MPLIEQLNGLREREQGIEEGKGMLTLEALTLRQEIMERIIDASLDADSVLSDLQYERALLQDMRAKLQTRRDHSVGISTLAGILIGSGVGVMGTAMQLSDRTAKAGNVIGVTAGSVATVLSLVAIRQQRGGKESLGETPNMLARFFARATAPDGSYPAIVCAYLDTVPPEGSTKGTLREQLMQEWSSMGRIDVGDSPTARRKVDLLTSSGSQRRDWNIEVITDREAMLSDVSARVALMKRDLGELMRTLGTPRADISH